nr:MAG TPA: hypothetical protein [Caudoviricetes sp.]
MLPYRKPPVYWGISMPNLNERNILWLEHTAGTPAF